MELSILCDQDIFISIYDRVKGKLVHYSSSERITLREVHESFDMH
jgi:hypothetical protein